MFCVESQFCRFQATMLLVSEEISPILRGARIVHIGNMYLAYDGFLVTASKKDIESAVLYRMFTHFHHLFNVTLSAWGRAFCLFFSVLNGIVYRSRLWVKMTRQSLRSETTISTECARKPFFFHNIVQGFHCLCFAWLTIARKVGRVAYSLLSCFVKRWSQSVVDIAFECITCDPYSDTNIVATYFENLLLSTQK